MTLDKRMRFGRIDTCSGTVKTGKDPVLSSPQIPLTAGSVLSLLAMCAVAFLASWSPNRSLLYGGLAAASIAVSDRLPRLSASEALAWSLAVWALSTMMWTSAGASTWQSAYLYVSAGLLFVAARHVVTTRARLIAIGCSYLAGCALTAVELILESLDSENLAARDSAFDPAIRFGVAGANINFTAYSLVTGVVVAIVLIKVAGQPRAVRLGLWAVIVMLAYGVLLNGTRGALIALILIAGYLLFSKPAPQVTWTIVAVVVPVLLVVVPLGLIGEQSLLWLDGLFEGRATGDLSGRLLVWPSAMSAWSQAPLVGNGAGVFPALNPYHIGPHTLLLTLGNDLGLIGVVLYAATFFTALAKPASYSLPLSRRLVGVFLAALLPIWLTGHWESSPGAWLALALLSVLPRVLGALEQGR